MKDFLSKIKFQLMYVFLWMAITVIHFFALHYMYNIEMSFALADSLIFNIIFSVLGIGLWFSIRFSSLLKKKTHEIFIQHLVSCLILLLIWLILSTSLLELMFGENVAYIDFLYSSLTLRVISGLLYYGLLVVIYYLISSFRVVEEKIKKEMQLTTMLKEAELEMLRSQIRPHFLFNSLNAISSLTISRPEQAQEMVIKLSEFMRYTLSQQGEMMSSLKKELQNIRLYLDIEQVRFGCKLNFSSDIDEKALSWAIPSLILQPLVENAIKYGIYGSEGKLSIKLKATCDESFLTITIFNNYDPDHSLRKGTGTGLKNISERLEAIYGRYDLMKINNTGSEFEVQLKIPKNAEN